MTRQSVVGAALCARSSRIFSWQSLSTTIPQTRAALAAAGVRKRTPFDCAVIDEYTERTQWGEKPEPRPPVPALPRATPGEGDTP